MQTIQLNESLVGLVLDGDYTILELLGTGGFGAAYRAQQISLGRQVCIKFLGLSSLSDPQNVQRFKREAKVLGRLRHKNIVECFSFGILQSVYPYLVMELVEGRSLRTILENGGLEWPQACSIVRQVCDALSFAHESGFIHRDVKPENIMLSGLVGHETVKLIDFGLVGKSVNNRLDTLTTPGSMVGTPGYMPPEAFTGALGTSSGDVYAAGCVLYECLTGRTPFDFDSPTAIAHRKNSGERLPSLPRVLKPDTVRDVLEQLIWRATAREPSERFGCADLIRVLVELELIAKGGGQCDSSDLLIPLSKKDSPRNSLSFKAAVLCVLVAAIAALAFQKTSYRDDTSPHNQGAFALAKPSSVRTELLSLIARARHIVLHEQNSPAAVREASVLRYCQLLDSTLCRYGTSPAFDTNSQIQGLAEPLCRITGDLIGVLGSSENDGVKRSLRASYIDVLSCCGYYNQALSAVQTNRLVKIDKIEKGSRQDLIHLFEELKKAFDSSLDVGAREEIVTRLRPSALRLSLIGGGGDFVRYLAMYRTTSITDPWTPTIGQIGLNVELQGKAQQVKFLCDLADAEKSDVITKQILLGLSAGPIPADREQFVITTLYRLGEKNQALKLFDSSQERLTRRGEYTAWSERCAALSYAMGVAGDMDACRALTSKLFASPNWTRLLASYSKKIKPPPAETLCIVDAASSLICQAVAQERQSELQRQKMRQAAELLVAGSGPVEGALMSGCLRYAEYAFAWELTDELSFRVVQNMCHSMGNNVALHGALLPQTNFDFAGRLLHANRSVEARTVFDRAADQVQTVLSDEVLRKDTLYALRLRVAGLRNSIFRAQVATILGKIDNALKTSEAKISSNR